VGSFVVGSHFAWAQDEQDKRDMKFIRSLAYTQDNDKPLSAYSNNDWHKQIFEEILVLQRGCCFG